MKNCSIKKQKKFIKSNNKDATMSKYMLLSSLNISDLSKKEESIQINKIKTNNYAINKPKEINLKYKKIDTTLIDETNEPLTKVTIGPIEGYKDIIEKDKIIDGNSTISIDNSSSKILILNGSTEIEKELVSLIQFKNESKNLSVQKKEDKSHHKQRGVIPKFLHRINRHQEEKCSQKLLKKKNVEGCNNINIIKKDLKKNNEKVNTTINRENRNQMMNEGNNVCILY